MVALTRKAHCKGNERWAILGKILNASCSRLIQLPHLPLILGINVLDQGKIVAEKSLICVVIFTKSMRTIFPYVVVEYIFTVQKRQSLVMYLTACT